MSLDLSNIQLKDIKYILAVYRKKSFRQASTICGVSQATISGQVFKLERLLNLKLIERNSRTVEFTPVGELIVNQFTIISEEFKNLSDIAFREQNRLTNKLGEFNIGIIPTLTPFFVSNMLNHLKEVFKEYKFNIVELTTDRIIDEFKFSNIDLAIVADHPMLQDTSLEQNTIGTDELVMLINKTNPSLREGDLDPNDIGGTKVFLLNEGNCLRDQARDICYHNLKDKNIIETRYGATSIETLKSIVANNLGVSIVPAVSINPSLQDDIYVSRIVKHPHRKLCLMFPKNSCNKDFYKKILRKLKQIYKTEYSKIDLEKYFFQEGEAIFDMVANNDYPQSKAKATKTKSSKTKPQTFQEPKELDDLDFPEESDTIELIDG